LRFKQRVVNLVAFKPLNYGLREVDSGLIAERETSAKARIQLQNVILSVAFKNVYIEVADMT